MLRATILRRRLKRFQKKVVEHNYCGYVLKASLQDDLAVGWYDRDWTAMPEVELLRTGRLKMGATVFDIGAHQGVVAMVLAKTVGDSGMVVAVEGTRHNADVALENCKINDLQNIRVRHAVGAERAGISMSFSETLNGAVGAGLLPVNVLSVSIDSLALEYHHPDVVFIDVEGYECQVLDGARQAIESGADFFVEVHAGCGLERHGSVERLLGHFESTNYRLFWSHGEQAQFQPLLDIATLPRGKFFLVALSASPIEP